VAKILALIHVRSCRGGDAGSTCWALDSRGINIQAITTSEIKVSVLIPMDYVELAVRVLHTAYGLDGPIAGDVAEDAESDA